jgi:hypothetical protein
MGLAGYSLAKAAPAKQSKTAATCKRLNEGVSNDVSFKAHLLCQLTQLNQISLDGWAVSVK